MYSTRRVGEVIRWGPLGPGGDPAASLQSFVPGVPVSGLGAMTPAVSMTAPGNLSIDPEVLRSVAPAMGYTPGWYVGAALAVGGLLGVVVGRTMK